MKLTTRLFGKTYQFRDIKEVLAKANEPRSGDVLAGVAAETAQERVAAKHVLSELTVADLRNNPVVPYEEDAVTRAIQDGINESAYDKIKNWTVSELREYIFCDGTRLEEMEFVRKGLASEVVAGVAKICSNADLIYGAKRMPVIKKANTTVGLPGTFSCRLQPNDYRDDTKSVLAQIYEGLSYGAGDAVIGINPVTDNVENVKRLLHQIYEVIDKYHNFRSEDGDRLTPMERYQRGEKARRDTPSWATMAMLRSQSTDRKVKPQGVSLGKIRYQDPALAAYIGKDVTVVTDRKEFGSSVEVIHMYVLRKRMAQGDAEALESKPYKYPVKLFQSARLYNIGEKEVKIIDKEMNITTIPADDIVSCNIKPNVEMAELYAKLEKAGVPVVTVGDAKSPRNLHAAVKEGAQFAIRLNPEHYIKNPNDALIDDLPLDVKGELGF